MALARINIVLQDDDGDIVDGASIEVRNEATLALAPVFSDRAGTVSLGNPFTAADGADAGFYVAGGSYKITATLGGFTRTIRHQPAGTLAEVDITDTPAVEDYEEGTWTPTLGWSVNNDLVMTVGSVSGIYTKIGRMASCGAQIINMTMTYTTGSGGLFVTNLPFAVAPGGEDFCAIGFQRITKANYTQYIWDAVGATNTYAFGAYGSGQNIGAVEPANVASGTTAFYAYGNCDYHSSS
jgi:hypothetical protein